MRRKSLAFISFCILAVAILVAIGPMEVSLNSVAAHITGGTVSSTKLDAIPTPEAEVLPTYPGAQAKAVAPEHQVPNATVTAFEVYAEASDVMAFYKNELIKKGWSVNLEVPARQLSMDWSDRSGNSPWNLDIDMPIRYVLDKAQNKMKTTWYIFLRRVPIPENVPVYPGATLTSSDTIYKEDYGALLQKIYVTSATISEVEAFYIRVLPECGWIGPGPKGAAITSADITVGLEYGFSLGTVYDVHMAFLSVQAKPLADGTTQIEVLSKGNTNYR